MSFGKGIKIGNVIGTGAMAVLLKGTLVATDQTVAVKLLLPRHMSNPEVAERFVREGETMALFQSPYLPKIHSLGTTDSGQPYIVMELLKGCDLEDVLRSPRRLSVREAVTYVRDACEGVAVAHEHGVVHRDIKPSNLFLAEEEDGSERVKLLDFGIAKTLPGLVGGKRTSTQLVLGTSLYMSPEQIQCSANVDVGADIWALGVVLFELLTKRLPFEAPTALATMQAVLRDRPPRISCDGDLTPGLDAVVARCLEKDPRDRYPSVRALSRALEPYARPEIDGPVYAVAVKASRSRSSSSDRVQRPTPATAATAATKKVDREDQRSTLRYGRRR